jgi:hypothetical protein
MKEEYFFEETVNDPETDTLYREQLKKEIEDIVQQLGFRETLEMEGLRELAIIGPHNISLELLELWCEDAQNIVKSISDSKKYKEAQIGLTLSQARMYLNADMPVEFYTCVDEAAVYASNLGLEDLAETLEDM